MVRQSRLASSTYTPVRRIAGPNTPFAPTMWLRTYWNSVRSHRRGVHTGCAVRKIGSTRPKTTQTTTYSGATNSAKSQSMPGAASTCHRCDRLGAAMASATGFEVLPDAVPGRVVGRAELEQPVGDVEPRLLHRGLRQLLGDVPPLHERLGVEVVLRGLGADEAEVGGGVGRLKHEVEEQVRDHGVVAAAQNNHEVVVDLALAVLREPVAQHCRRRVLRQVVLRVDDVARPHLGDAELTTGQVAVHVDGDLRRRRLLQRTQVAVDEREVLRGGRVEVGLAVA